MAHPNRLDDGGPIWVKRIPFSNASSRPRPSGRERRQRAETWQRTLKRMEAKTLEPTSRPPRVSCSGLPQDAPPSSMAPAGTREMHENRPSLLMFQLRERSDRLASPMSRAPHHPNVGNRQSHRPSPGCPRQKGNAAPCGKTRTPQAYVFFVMTGAEYEGRVE